MVFPPSSSVRLLSLCSTRSSSNDAVMCRHFRKATCGRCCFVVGKFGITGTRFIASERAQWNLGHVMRQRRYRREYSTMQCFNLNGLRLLVVVADAADSVDAYRSSMTCMPFTDTPYLVLFVHNSLAEPPHQLQGHRLGKATRRRVKYCFMQILSNSRNSIFPLETRDLYCPSIPLVRICTLPT